MAGRFSIEAIFKAKDRFTAVTAKMSSRFAKFARRAKVGLRDANKAASKFIGGLKKIGLASAAVGVAVGAGLGSIIKTGAEFEQAIINVGAVGLQTRDQIADLEKEALRLGATTKFTATESANAMEIMARAGFKNKEILGSVGSVLNAAAASGLEIAEVADHVSSAMKGMGLEVIDAKTGMNNAARVADVLALASSRTNSSIGSLGESLKNVAGTASDLNIPLEDTVGAVALLQDVGLDASVAGSALNTMLTNIAAGTNKVSKRAKDANGNLKSFPELLNIISEEAAASGGNMDRVAFLADLVGLRGQKAASKLSKLFDSGKVSTLTDELQEAKGVAEKMMKLRQKGLVEKWTLFESAVDGVKNALFKLESGPLHNLVEGMTKWINANQELIVSKVQEFIKDFRDALPTIVYWMTKIGRAVAFLTALAVGVKVLSAAVAAFNVIMAMNPIGIVIVSLVALTALAIAFWPEIKEIAAAVWSWMKQKASEFGDWISGVWDSTKEKTSTVWTSIKDFIGGIWEGIKTIALTALNIFLNFHPLGLIIKHWTPIKAFFAGLWDSVKQMFFDAIEGVMNKMRSVVSFFSGMIDTMKGALGFDVDAAANPDGTGADGDAPGQGSAASGASVVTPAERVARSISESRHSETVDVNINDNSGGKATVSRRSSGRKPPPGLQPSGAF